MSRTLFEPTNVEEIDGLLRRERPIQLAMISFSSPAIIAWLVMLKPF